MTMSSTHAPFQPSSIDARESAFPETQQVTHDRSIGEIISQANNLSPEQIEQDITGRFERFFTLGSGIDHIESRSLTGVSLIKIYFQPGTSADSAVSQIANLALANLRRLPPGTLPPVVLKFEIGRAHV